MQALTIYSRRGRLLGITALMIGLGALGVWLLLAGRPGERSYGWFLIIATLLSLPQLTRVLLDRRPRIVIDDNGISDRSQGVGTIPWDDIVTASLPTQRTVSFINLQLRQPKDWVRKMSRWRRWIVALNRSAGYSEIYLNLALTDADVGHVLRLILERTGHFGATRLQVAVTTPPDPTSPAAAGSDLNEAFPVRYSPAFALSAHPTNSLGLTGRGSLAFAGTDLTIHGKRNRLFRSGARLDYAFQRDDVVNLFRTGRVVKLDIVARGKPSQTVHLWAKDENAAIRIAAALPSLTTEEAIRASAEARDFQSRLTSVGGRAWVTPILVGINVAVFLAAALDGAGFMAPNGEVLVRWGTNYGPLTMDGQWWRLITSVFLHFGLVHLLFNMFALFSSGRLVERLFGSPLFLLLYLVAGLSGSFGSLLLHPDTNSAGASGAIFGVYGALIAYFLRKDTMVPPSIVRQQRSSAVAFVGYNLFLGLSHQGIDNAAHVGGLLGGFVLGYFMARPLDATHRAQAAISFYLRGAAIAAIILGSLFVAVMHFSVGPINDRRLRRDIATIAGQEQTALQVFNDAVKQSRAKTLDDQVFAERMETGVIPLWESMATTIGADQPDPDSKLMPVWTLYRNYISSRRDAFNAYDAALRNQDPAKMQMAQTKFHEGDVFMNQLQKLPNP